MTTACPRHNNVVQFLEVSKNCQVTLTRVLHVLEKKLFKFCFKCCLFMKELNGAILSQNHRRRQGVAQGARAPSIEMPAMTKI